MFKVEVKKGGLVTNGAQFSTLIEAQEWVASLEEKNGFGKRDRWVKDDDIAKEGEDIALALETKIESDPVGGTSTYFKFPKDYTVEITDITEQHNDSKVEAAALQRIEFGKKLLSKVFLINKKKKEAGQLDKVKFAQMMADKNLAAIERLFNNGSLETAKEMIQALDESYFDAGAKADFIALITDYLAKEAAQ